MKIVDLRRLDLNPSPNLMPLSAHEESPGIRPKFAKMMGNFSKYRDSALVRKALFSVGWSTFGQVVELAVKMFQSVIMTRLMTLDDNAVINIAFTVITTLEWFSDLGVSPALMRHPQGMSRRYLMTGWTLNVIRGLLISLLVFSIAYPVSNYAYGLPRLAPILIAVGWISTIQSLKTPNFPMLQHSLNFRGLFLIRVTLILVNTAVTITLGFLTLSPWSMVVGMLVGSVASVLVSYLISPSRPVPTLDREAVGEIATVTAQVMPNTFAMAMQQYTMRLIALPFGLVSTKSLALFMQATTLATAGESFLMAGIGVYFSMLCRIEDEEARQKWNARAMLGISLVLMPIIGCFALTGPLVVRVLYDPRYHGSGIPLSIMVCKAMARLIGQIQFQNLIIRSRIRFTTVSYLAAWGVEILLLILFKDQMDVRGLALLSLASAMTQTLVQGILAKKHGEPILPIFVTFGVIGLTLMLIFQMA